jgi:hypothetical protein
MSWSAVHERSGRTSKAFHVSHHFSRSSDRLGDYVPQEYLERPSRACPKPDLLACVTCTPLCATAQIIARRCEVRLDEFCLVH